MPTTLTVARPHRALAPQRVLLLAWWLVTALAVAAGSATVLRKVVHHDVGYWIDAAGRLLDGAVLYRDLIELNPPTNYAITLLPVALARGAGLDPVLTFHAFVLGLAVLAATMSACVLRRVLDDMVTAQLIFLPLAIVFLALPHHDFGQREHILAMLVLPYFLLTAAQAPEALPRTLRVASGVLAGAVVAYKPYFILYPVAAEGIRLLYERKLSAPLRLETVAMGAVIVGAAIAAALLFPDYMHFIIPLGRAVYHGFEAPLAAVLMQTQFVSTLVVSGATIMLLRGTGNGTAARRCGAVLVGAAIAGLIVYLVQMKGWRYHVLPALMLATTALSLLLVERVAQGLCNGSNLAVLGGGLAFAAIITAHLLQTANAVNEHIRAEIAPLVDAVRREAKGGPALFLSTNLDYGFPVVNYAGVPWPYRYHHLLPLPGLYAGYRPGPDRAFRTPAEMGPIEAGFFATVVEDTLRFPPRMILVDRRAQVPPINKLGFDILAYFRQDPRFDGLVRSYQPAGRIAGQDIYLRRE
jgi:hypothetical protein